LPPQPGKTSRSNEFELTKRMPSLTIHTPTPKRGLDLIQRNLTQPNKWSGRGNLAFDKCTLLSSQGSDAPTNQPTTAGQPSRATSQSYPPRSVCQTDAPRHSSLQQRSMTAVHERKTPILDPEAATSKR
jgi:hypothetical protein